MRHPVLVLVMIAILTGCEDLGLKAEKFNHQVKDVRNDEYFII